MRTILGSDGLKVNIKPVDDRRTGSINWSRHFTIISMEIGYPNNTLNLLVLFTGHESSRRPSTLTSYLQFVILIGLVQL